MLNMWARLCENPACVFKCVPVWKRLGVIEGWCGSAHSPVWGVCVSDENSLLSARFSTLPAAMKRARPSLAPPRGFISFFILSAIQLDFLWEQRERGPFMKRNEMSVSVIISVCVSLYFRQDIITHCVQSNVLHYYKNYQSIYWLINKLSSVYVYFETKC